MDSGGLEALFLAFLQSQWPLDDVLADIILLGEVVELADVAGTLWSKATWNGDVGQSGNFLFTLADNDEGKSREVGIDDASTD